MKEYYTYDAFISYRHTDLDKFVAENLHKRLEAFKLPHSASKNRLEGEKTRIKRIFRDKDELPIASDLASPIMTALNESEFLIVICSPRTPESIWVKREIETFISLHGRDHILAVLIEGEPEESFPPALLTARKEVTLEDGTKSIQKVAVEPLAADVRGKNRHEVMRNIKRELLRLAAPMFDCSYDDLKQRHRQRKIKRIITTFVIANIFFIGFGSFSTIQALRISKQSKQIQQQSEEIRKQSDQITEQYQKILISSLNTLADTSLRLLNEGDRMKSILVAKAALPASSTNLETPFVPHAEYALAEALYVYENESLLLSDRALDHDTDVEFMIPSPSGDRLLTIESTGIATVWDASLGEPITTFIAAEDPLYHADENSFSFLNEAEIVYSSDNTVKRYNCDTEKIIWETEDSYFYSYAFSPDNTIMAATNYEEIRIYDLSNGTVIASYQVESGHPYIGQEMVFSSDSKLLAFTSNSVNDDGNGEISIINTADGSIFDTIQTELPYICDLCFTDNRHLAIAANSHVDLSEDFFMVDDSGDVILYNLNEKAQQWKVRFSGETIYTLELSACKEPFLIAQGYDSINPLVLSDGSLMGSMTFSSQIIDCVSYNDNTYGYCLTRDGLAQSINYDGGIIYDAYFEANSSNIKASVRAGNYVGILPYSSRQVILYRYVENPGMEQLASLENDVFYADINYDSTNYFVTSSVDGYQLICFDYQTKEELFTIKSDIVFSDVSYVGKNDAYIMIMFTDEFIMYDAHTGKMVKEITYEDCGFADSYLYNNDINKLFVFQSRGFTVYDMDQMVLESTYINENVINLNNCPVVTTFDGTTYLVANIETGMLEEYAPDSPEPVRSKEFNTNYITNLFYNDDGTQLFVVYKNRHVEVYQADDFTLLHTYTDFNGSSTKYIPLDSAEGDYILANNYQGYLCTKDHQVKAYFPHLKALDSVNKKILAHAYRKLYTMPIYDLDMLLKEADIQLHGRKLSDADKTELYMQP